MKSKNIIIASILIAIGVFFLVKSLFGLPSSLLLKYSWPIVVFAAGAIQLYRKQIPIVGGILLMGTGVVFEAKYLGLLPPNFFSLLWPVGLILLGIWILVRRAQLPDRLQYDDDISELYAIFSGGDYRIQSQNYQGGNVFSVFGGLDIDLRDAKITSAGAVLDALIIFAGAKIRIPHGWRVVITGLPIFGGWENKTETADISPDAPVIYVKALVIFGGLEVKSYAFPREAQQSSIRTEMAE